jgi:hypothetical protein
VGGEQGVPGVSKGVSRGLTLTPLRLVRGYTRVQQGVVRGYAGDRHHPRRDYSV